MKGIGPELPLSRDHRFGLYSLVTSYKDEIKQNFKNLLLTSPGERIMNPDFGVGLRQFLFDPDQHAIPGIRQRIVQQASKYMPFIKINKMKFSSDGELNGDANALSINIEYIVPSINLSTSIVLQPEDLN